MFMRLFILMGLAMVMAPSLAQAACTNNEDGVPGVAGEIEYFTADNMLRYCDGTNWIDMTDATDPRTSFGGDPNERVVFVTSDLEQAISINGVPGADTQCQSLADTAGLKGTYFAWITGDTATEEPANRFEQSTVPYVRTTGVQIADNWTDLTDGTLDNEIQFDENGISIPSTNQVFTNTDTDGTQFSATDHCSDFSAATGNTRTGDLRFSTSDWTSASAQACSSNIRLYCFEQSTDPVSHWKLDETAGTTAVDAMGNNDLTYLFGADPTSHSETGVIGNGFNFATPAGGYGNNTTATPSIWSTGAFSVSLWLKPTEDVDSYGAVGIFEIADFFRIQKSALGRMLLRQDAWTVARGAQLISPIIPTNQWTHLTVTFDYNAGFGTNPTFYLNGVNETNINSFSGSGPYTVPSQNQIALGRRFDSGGTQFRGVIDDVRLYNRVLMPSEVQVLNNCTGPGTYFYNATDDVMQWCDGVNSANNMHQPNPQPVGTGCLDSGVEPNMNYYNRTGINENTYYVCVNDEWRPIGKGCANCGGSPTEKIVFATSSSHVLRDIGGIAGADAICQARADNAGLSGDYDAWLADSNAASAPATRFSATLTSWTNPIVQPDGIKIADNWADLIDGNIDAAIDKTEFGAKRVTNVLFFPTNVNSNGTQFSASNTCSNWTANDGSTVKAGRFSGTSGLAGSYWTNHPSTGINCNSTLSLYCFEQ